MHQPGKNIVYYQQKKIDYTLPPILILYMIIRKD